MNFPMSSIAGPNIAFLLVIFGALCVYVEFVFPGRVLPGVAGGVLALLGISRLVLLPINPIGAALLLASAFLFAARFGVAGIIAMILGVRFLVDAPPDHRIYWSTAIAASIPFGWITVLLLNIASKARANKLLTSNPT